MTKSLLNIKTFTTALAALSLMSTAAHAAPPATGDTPSSPQQHDGGRNTKKAPDTDDRNGRDENGDCLQSNPLDGSCGEILAPTTAQRGKGKARVRTPEDVQAPNLDPLTQGENQSGDCLQENPLDGSCGEILAPTAGQRNKGKARVRTPENVQAPKSEDKAAKETKKKRR